MNHRPEQLVFNYLSHLLTPSEAELLDSTEQKVASHLSNTFHLSNNSAEPLSGLGADPGQQTQIRSNSQPSTEASPRSETATATPSRSPFSIAQPIAQRTPAVATQSLGVGDLVPWCANGRPMWAQQRFDVLLLEVSGLSLALPLFALEQVRPLMAPLTPTARQEECLIELQPEATGAAWAINTALLVMPERYNASFLQRARHLITLTGLDWGLAVEAVRESITIDPDAVTWRTSRSKRPWLAGTVRSARCALLDIPQVDAWQNHIRRRTT